MNPHELMWDCKRSVPEVSVIDERDENDFYYPRSGFPVSSTPPLTEPKVVSKPTSPDMKKILSTFKRELFDALKERKCSCAEKEKSKDLATIRENQKEIMKKIDKMQEEMHQFRADLGKMSQEQFINKLATLENATQTSMLSPKAIRPPYCDIYPQMIKMAQQSDISMAADKVLQKYMKVLPQRAPKAMEDKFLFNLTNVSVAMQRTWQPTSPFDPAWENEFRRPHAHPRERVPFPMSDYSRTDEFENHMDLSAIMNQPKLL